ncbi:MAG: acyl carrier protein phosphodiesterase [Psychromonas sp.]|jgi:acyl carrier protein phosphodiesterase|uniref:acyl carrier protein phosphodiesterase n=1 Tax=Psychromonas sp. TaxID=1884585 RepID=UPI0039E71A47
MNFLAHLHIAEHTETSFVGNFLGDFVKGNPIGQFDVDIVQGIRLHRFVDSYTDQHQLVKLAKPLFAADLRRYAPIALDMFWDHFLAKHWSQFHDLSLGDFCRQAQLQIELESSREINAFPEHFKKISTLVWQERWLESYQKIENIQYALARMSLRSVRMAPLALTGETLVKHYQRLSEIFFELYADLLDKTAAYVTGRG